MGSQNTDIEYKDFSLRHCFCFKKCLGEHGEKYFGEKRILEMENMEI